MQRKKLIAELLEIKQKQRFSISLLQRKCETARPRSRPRFKRHLLRIWTKEPHKTRKAATALKALSEINTG